MKNWWAEHVGRMGRGKVYTLLWWGLFRERDYLEDLDEDGRKILKWSFKKWDGAHGLEWVSIETVAGLL
jgi:hypothetical protein